MTSDIFSHGSGLAVSSSYACSLTYAINLLKNKNITNIECGIQAHSLEKKINPLLGLQDVFGCCIGGFKKIEFFKGKLPKYTFLPTQIFQEYDAYLYFTGYTRSSTEILKGVKVPDIDTFNPLVDEAEACILNGDYSSFMNIIKYGWEEKKKTSTTVLENPDLKALDKWLSTYDKCSAHKLCGAGNGGFFLAFFKKGTEVPKEFHKIELNTDGVKRLI
jgi:D-glycero-alpha-D-manno-heptose-7-phosphate kinase